MLDQIKLFRIEKIDHFQSIFGMLLLTLALNSCVQDDQFNTPDLSIIEPELGGPIITIDAVAGFLAQEQGGDDLDYSDENTTYTFDGTNSYVSGYVISSDEAGNFFEEVLLQDKAEDPSIGIKLLIDVNPLFTRYDTGRKIYVKLDGLSAGITNGVFTIGLLNGLEVDKIPAPLEDVHIVRSAEKVDLVPLPISLNNLEDAMTNLYVSLSDVQFQRGHVLIDNPLTFAAEPTDEFDGERILEDCSNDATVIFSTSTFADFKGIQLPAGRGSISAILTKNFFGESFNIVVNSASDIVFDNTQRCDPDFLSCETASGGGSILNEEDFEEFTGFVAEGWTNVNVGGGTEEWEIGSFSGNAYAQISGFDSGEDAIDVWLVTPAINLDGTSGEELSFDVQTSFNNGNILSVWVTTNFSGDPTTADWTLLDALIPEGSPAGFGTFEPVGPINISCLDGDIHIGLFYNGADPHATTRYHVDNFEVTGN